MSIESLCALGGLIKQVTAPNCALFLWAVWPSIFEYVQPLLKSWGFTYKTLAFEWIKLNRSGIGWHIGMGYYCRANPEPCLLAVKGKMPVATKSERNLLIEYEDEIAGLPLVSPVRQHSQKPAEQYAKIERLYPNRRYLELFARGRRDGWTSIGNGVSGKDIADELCEMAGLF